MNAASAPRFQFDYHGIDWIQLERLFQAADMGGRMRNKIHRAFEKSQVVCFVTVGGRLIGAGRAITDGEYHGVIYDIVVHPDHQGAGIGTRLMEEIMKRLPVWRIMLVAEGSVQSFYTRLGFKLFLDAMTCFDQGKLYDGPRQ